MYSAHDGRTNAKENHRDGHCGTQRENEQELLVVCLPFDNWYARNGSYPVDNIQIYYSCLVRRVPNRNARVSHKKYIATIQETPTPVHLFQLLEKMDRMDCCSLDGWEEL